MRHKVSHLKRNLSPREAAQRDLGSAGANRAGEHWAAVEHQRELRLTLSSHFSDFFPLDYFLNTEPLYQEKVRELGQPRLSRAPKMPSIRKRWTICTISLLLIFYKTKEIARTEEHQETQLIG
uniref:Uncharacterized protein n=1 Tax=Castor canadensis TaxID=51338 RepID=A0A8C0W0P5_CASCN